MAWSDTRHISDKYRDKFYQLLGGGHQLKVVDNLSHSEGENCPVSRASSVETNFGGGSKSLGCYLDTMILLAIILSLLIK